MRGPFGPFRMEKQVGRGGLGKVYRAVDTRSAATVAVKLLQPGSDTLARTRLEREFAALRQIDHPNIVRVLDLGESDRTLWLEMELVEGLNIRDWLTICGEPTALEPEPDPDEEGAHGSEGVDLDALYEEPDSGALLSRARARKASAAGVTRVSLDEREQEAINAPHRLLALCEALAQVGDGLAYIHGRELVHRDVKPSNILVTAARRAILVDFGLVKRVTEPATTDVGRVVGSYHYMSPEQARGLPLDGRSDLYSVGATLYELLAGRPPFTQEVQIDLLEALVFQPPKPVAHWNPGAPPALARLAEHLLAKSADDRPSDASEVALMLRAVARGLARGR